MRYKTMRGNFLLELFAVVVLSLVVAVVAGGCSGQSGPCLVVGPPPAGCPGGPPLPETPEEKTPEDGTEGISGIGSLDTFEGNIFFTVIVGSGTPPGQLCTASFQSCVNVANGIPGNEIVDVEVLTSDPDQEAPVIANLALITPSSLLFVNMTTRAATNSGITFTAPPTDVEPTLDFEWVYVAAGNNVTTVEVDTRRSARVTTFPTAITSVAPGSENDEGDFFACGTGACYHAVDNVPVVLEGVAGGQVIYGGERTYIANPTQGVVVLDSATGARITTFAFPNARQCVMHAAGDCITCVAQEGNETRVVEFDTVTEQGYREIRLPGTNTFLETNFTSRTFAIGQQVQGTGGVIHSCTTTLDCTARPNALNRRAAFAPVNQPR